MCWIEKVCEWGVWRVHTRKGHGVYERMRKLLPKRKVLWYMFRWQYCKVTVKGKLEAACGYGKDSMTTQDGL
jgi:hypothetical protein